jgi:predicted metal-dependent phosphotriesterase family hydrolase
MKVNWVNEFEQLLKIRDHLRLMIEKDCIKCLKEKGYTDRQIRNIVVDNFVADFDLTNMVSTKSVKLFC